MQGLAASPREAFIIVLLAEANRGPSSGGSKSQNDSLFDGLTIPRRDPDKNDSISTRQDPGPAANVQPRMLQQKSLGMPANDRRPKSPVTIQPRGPPHTLIKRIPRFW